MKSLSPFTVSHAIPDVYVHGTTWGLVNDERIFIWVDYSRK